MKQVWWFILLIPFFFVQTWLLEPKHFFAGNKSNIIYLDSSIGNDNNSGTSPQTPWKTLNRLNQHTFKPGDKILFKSGGIYPGQLKPQGAGTKSNPIKIDKYGEGAKPELQGGGLVDATLHLYNTQGWEVQNLSISNHGVERMARRFGIHVELKDYGIAESIQLKNIDVHNVNGSLVKKEGGGAGIVFTNSGRRIRSKFDGVLIENCSIKATARNGILINGYWERSNWFPNKNVVIRKNLIEGVPGDGIVPVGCDSALVEYNVMRDCPRLLPDGEAAAGIWPWSSDNTLIQYNEVSDHKAPWDAQGFDADWNCRNTIIQYNYSHDNEGGFLLICDDGSASKRSSIGNVGTIVRYNLSVNDGLRASGKHAGFSPLIHIAGPVRNSSIYNNVIYMREKPAGIDSTLVSITDWQGFSDSIIFANNIFYTKTEVNYEISKGNRTIFEHNIYYGTHIDKPNDPFAVFLDPKFVISGSPGLPGLKSADNFRISNNSPAIGKGKVMINKSLKDFFGNIVLNTDKPSIGLHQVN